MKKVRNILLGALSAMMIIPTSCVQEEPAGSKAILPGQKEIVMPVEASSQTFTIYADANWEADVTDTWLSINPMTGFGTVEVTLTAEENPETTSREAQIIIKGGDKLEPVEITVIQKGDRYRAETEKSVSDVIALTAGSLAKVAQSQVVALTKEAFVVTDGTSMLLVKGYSSDVKVGSKVTLNGDVIEVNGLIAVQLDELTSVVEGEYTPGQPKNITNEMAYAPGKVEYVELTATYTAAGSFQVNGTDVAAPFLPAVTMATYANHNVKVVGYYVGTVKGLAAIHVTAVEDLGEAAVEGVVFEDNFEWLDEIAKAVGSGDAVGTDNASAKAMNVWKMTESESQKFFNIFNQMGYQYIYGTKGSTSFVAGPAQAPNASVGKDGSLYVMANYLKFGQSDYNAGLVLPALTRLESATDVVVEFDWCWQVTGANKPDLMTLQLDATVGTFADSGASTSLELESAQSKVDGESHIAWQHVKVVLTGATAETVITIRPTNADPYVQNSARGQNRWYLDNIKITKAEGEVLPPASGATLLDDNFDWIAQWADAAGAADSVTDQLGGTAGAAPNAYDTKPEVEGFLTEFANRGYVDLNPTAKTIYLQKYYLKLGKKSNQTGLQIPALSTLSAPTDVVVSFDWCAHMGGTKKVDDVSVTVELEGDGVVTSTGTSISESYVTTQQVGVDEAGVLEWVSTSVQLTGVTSQTKIKIRPTNMGTEPIYQRWFIDNIKVTVK